MKHLMKLNRNKEKFSLQIFIFFAFCVSGVWKASREWNFYFGSKIERNFCTKIDACTIIRFQGMKYWIRIWKFILRWSKFFNGIIDNLKIFENKLRLNLIMEININDDVSILRIFSPKISKIPNHTAEHPTQTSTNTKNTNEIIRRLKTSIKVWNF